MTSRLSVPNPIPPAGRVGAARAIVLALLLAAAASTPAQTTAGQYRWKDARGQVHVSDMPPPRDIPERDILVRPGPRRAAAPATVAPPPALGAAPATGTPATGTQAAGSAASAASAPASGARGGSAVDRLAELRRQQADDEKKAAARADDERQKAQRADSCQRARQQLAALDSGMRMARVDAQGQRTVLDDAARAAEAAAARQAIEANCR